MANDGYLVSIYLYLTDLRLMQIDPDSVPAIHLVTVSL